MTDPSRARALGEQAGGQIDRYTLVEEIGEGGMGTVWMAEQATPVRRKVALKVIKLGMDTKEVVARFDAERQALALMDHPGIAKVLDGGSTDSGRPYFVMELVNGAPITDYCDRVRMDISGRLELFIQVCTAIQHAHQKGVIHRDIKPSNVLVGDQELAPQPKVIDFGIAKATGVELTQHTLFTQHGQIVGTPEYMAPEQAETTTLDIDTRADVYSLGVLLYELLTGTTPFNLRQVMAAGYEELLRTIREVDPDRPSTRVSTLGDQAMTIAAARGGETGQLSVRLRRDLDWIVMKALEKDRARRYETASGFADDVRRFLNDEVVTAAPPGAGYRLSKFIRRRRKTVAAAGAIVTLLVAGSIGTGIGWWETRKANKALDKALGEKAQALIEEELQRSLATENARKASENARRASENEREAREAQQVAQERAEDLEQVASFYSLLIERIDVGQMGASIRRQLHDSLQPEDHTELESRLRQVNFADLALSVVEGEMFEGSLDTIETEYADQPGVQAKLFQAVGNSAAEIGLLDFAVSPMDKALVYFQREQGERDVETLESLNRRGRLHQSQGELAASEAMLRRVLDLRSEVLGPNHELTLVSLNNLASVIRDTGRYREALELNEDCYQRMLEHLGPENTNTIATLNNLGLIYEDMGRFAEREAIARQALKAQLSHDGEHTHRTVPLLSNLAMALKKLERPEEALDLFRETLARSLEIFGSDHPRTAVYRNNLAAGLQDLGRHEEALEHYLSALAFFESRFGARDMRTLATRNNIASAYRSQGRLDRALPMLAEVRTLLRQEFGDQHPNAINTSYSYGTGLVSVGRNAEARSVLIEAHQSAIAVLGATHSLTTRIRDLLGRELKRAIEAARESGEGLELAGLLADLGRHRLRIGSFEEAEMASGEAFDLYREEFLEDDPRCWRATMDLGEAVARQGRLEEADELLSEGLGRMVAAELDPDDALFAQSVERMLELLDSRHSSEPGAGHDQRAAVWRARLQSSDRVPAAAQDPARER